VCGPEFSDLETTIWQTYQSDGVMVFGINRLEDPETVRNWVEQFGVTFPVLLDTTAQVYIDYLITGCSTPFPRDFIIDQSGVVQYLACEYEPEAMIAVIDSLLSTIDVPDTRAPGAPQPVQNRPNPFASSTTIRFDVPTDGLVEIDIYNAAGAHVRRLLSRSVVAGSHAHVWDGTDDTGRPAPSGVYFYRFRTNEHSWSKELILMR
jgi:hypothetical protein